MGRGGGAGGGGHSSSGRSSSGGHSFSGRSGGGGSSSSFGRGSGASRPSSYHSSSSSSSFGRSSSAPQRRVAPPPPPPPRRVYEPPRPSRNTVIINNSGNSYREPSYREPRYSSSPSYSSSYSSSRNTYDEPHTGGGALSAMLSAFVVMIILTIAFSIFAGKPQTQVEKLPVTACGLLDYDDLIVDDLGWTTEDGSAGTKAVKQGMEYFYQKTGVQPMFVLSDKIGNSTASNYKGSDIEATLESMYKDTFGEDEGHAIFAVLTNDGADNYSYISCLAGTYATQVLGDTQKEMLYDAWDRQWVNLNQSEADMVANTFKTAADKIMRKPTHIMSGARNVCFIIDIILLIAIVIMVLSRNKTKRLEEENRHIEAVNDQYNKATGSSSIEDDDLFNKYN